MTAPASIKPVTKDRWFYDQYEYSLGFWLDEVNCLRELSHEHVDQMIQRRQQWREIAQQRWNQGQRQHSILGRRFQPITEQTVADLHELTQHLLTAVGQFKLVVTVNQAHVYTNDLALIAQLQAMPALKYQTLSQAVITRARETVQLRRPRHAWRTYLRHIKITAEQKQHLISFLQGQHTQVRLAPSLVTWMDQPYLRTQDYFFVDHDSEAWPTMLALVQPGVIRKTLAIVTAK